MHKEGNINSIIITSFIIIINSFFTIRNIAVQRNIEEGNSNSAISGWLVTNSSKETRIL